MSFKERFIEKKKEAKEKIAKKVDCFWNFIDDHPVATKVIFWETLILMAISASAAKNAKANEIKARKYDELSVNGKTDIPANLYDDYDTYKTEWEENYKDKYEAGEKFMESLKLEDGECLEFTNDEGFIYSIYGETIYPPEDID